MSIATKFKDFKRHACSAWGRDENTEQLPTLEESRVKVTKLSPYLLPPLSKTCFLGDADQMHIQLRTSHRPLLSIG